MYLGIDIGTTSLGATLIDRSGTVVRTSSVKNTSILPPRYPGNHIQDGEWIEQTVRGIISDFTDAFSVEGIAVTGQMHGAVFHDSEGRAVTPLYTWQDQTAALTDPDTKDTYLSRIEKITPIRTGYGAAACYALKRKGELPPETAGFSTINNFVAARLCGRTKPLSDSCEAAGLGFFDTAAGNYDFSAVKKAGLDREYFPDLAETGALIGTEEHGIPVYLCCGDNQAGFLGAVADPADTVLISLGTSGQISFLTDSYQEFTGWETRPFPGNAFLQVGAVLCGGIAFDRMVRFYGDIVTFLTGEKVNPYKVIDSLDTLDEEGAAPLNVDTRFLGTRDDSGIRGAVTNIGMDNLTPLNLLRGTADGIAAELYSFVRFAESAVKEKRRLAGCGNGIEKNAFVRTALEKAFGRPLEPPRAAESVSFGAAILAKEALKKERGN